MYNYLEIKEWSVSRIRSLFPERDVRPYYPSGSWQTSRYIQFSTVFKDNRVHYEYRIDENWDGRIELHFEGDDYDSHFGKIIDYLIDRTQENESFIWSDWHCGYRCQYDKVISSIELLNEVLQMFMGLFDKYMSSFSSEESSIEQISISEADAFAQQSETIDIHTATLKTVLGLPMSIPNYQRIYCWEEDNVKCLLNDLLSHINSQDKSSTPYRLGAIILHNHDGKYDIIDGQQRLVTLSLLLNELGVHSKLIDEKLSSKRSIEHVAYNKFIINGYIQKHINDINFVTQQLLNSVEFSVLVLKNASIDLAYTFFSNQNSRGVVLSDYDLLKAHHLRYIPQNFEQQSLMAAEVWDKMIEEGREKAENETDPDYVCTLDTYIYKLRRWMRKKECDDSTDKYRVKKEYEAAPIIDELPPFGEKFYFDEPIQGGTHFFSYVEQHLAKYKHFVETQEYQILHVGLTGGSFQWYRESIESLLFGYYLKFGEFYLSDSLMLIMRIILQHRYNTVQARKRSIIKYAGNSDLILMINQATSPTFFLAEAREVAKELIYPNRQSMTPIMLRMRNKASAISRQLNKKIFIDSLKNLNR